MGQFEIRLGLAECAWAIYQGEADPRKIKYVTTENMSRASLESLYAPRPSLFRWVSARPKEGQRTSFIKLDLGKAPAAIARGLIEEGKVFTPEGRQIKFNGKGEMTTRLGSYADARAGRIPFSWDPAEDALREQILERIKDHRSKRDAGPFLAFDDGRGDWPAPELKKVFDRETKLIGARLADCVEDIATRKVGDQIDLVYSTTTSARTREWWAKAIAPIFARKAAERGNEPEALELARECERIAMELWDRGQIRQPLISMEKHGLDLRVAWHLAETRKPVEIFQQSEVAAEENKPAAQAPVPVLSVAA